MKSQKKKTKKETSINIRVTVSERESIKQIAEHNDMTLSAYALNQMLYSTDGIYTQDFRDCLFSIIGICNNFPEHDPASCEALSELKEEVQKLCLCLK